MNGFFQFFKNSINRLFQMKQPIIKENTFLLWEPCSKSHSEVLPGYARYLLDLGYHVSVLTNTKHYKDGLFSLYGEENISYNKMSKKQIRKYFKTNDLSNVKGLLVTTTGKLCDSIHYVDCYKSFSLNVDKSKIYFVEHEIKPSVDAGTWKENIITLRKMNYKNAQSVVVNPHYFGNVEIRPKNSDVTNLITIGAIRSKRKNANMIVDAVKKLHESGVRNFKITVVGKGQIKDLPKELRCYFDIKGRLPFNKMYQEIQKADYILTAYESEKHQRYNTTGTSGVFQLAYGFLKPCIILEEFAGLNGFDEGNSIMYKSADDYADAIKRAIVMSKDEYATMQNYFKNYVEFLYNSSFANLKELISK